MTKKEMTKAVTKTKTAKKSIKSKTKNKLKLKSKKQKINKELFIAAIAERTGMTIASVTSVFEAYQNEIIERVSNNEEISITGFGRFYVQRHKGHPVQFSTATEKVHDYVVFKFSASNVLNSKLREIDAVNRIG